MADPEWRRMVGWWLMAAAAVWLVSGCATGGGKEEEEEPTKARPVLVGRVASMPKDENFVLLQSYGAWTVPPGSPVYCIGDNGRMANLLPTGEKLGQFVAADRRDGEVRVGDAIYYRPDGGKPVAPLPMGLAGDVKTAGGEAETAPNHADPASQGSIEPELP